MNNKYEKPDVLVGGIYKHFKGDHYIVQDLALDTETNKILVIYKKLFEPSFNVRDKNNLIVYARPLEMFTSLVDKKKYPTCEQEKRFEFEQPYSHNSQEE